MKSPSKCMFGWAQPCETKGGSLPPQHAFTRCTRGACILTAIGAFVAVSEEFARAQSRAPGDASEPPAAPSGVHTAPSGPVGSAPPSVPVPYVPPSLSAPSPPTSPPTSPPSAPPLSQPSASPPARSTAPIPTDEVPSTGVVTPSVSTGTPTTEVPGQSPPPAGTHATTTPDVAPRIEASGDASVGLAVGPNPVSAAESEGGQHAATGGEPAPQTAAENGAGELQLALLLDANYAVSSSHRDARAPIHRPFVWVGADGGMSNGFGLEWFGADLTYRYHDLVVRSNLRFGDGAQRLLRDRSSGNPIVPVAEAYVSWEPSATFGLDVGQFGTSIGADSYDAFRNLNYSEGALYGVLQPWWHTGVRAHVEVGEWLALEGSVVNGVNSTFDEDDAPSAALRVRLHNERLGEFQVGAYRTFDTAKDTSGYDTVIDVVGRLRVKELQIVASGIANGVETDPIEFGDSTEASDGRAQPVGGVAWGASLGAAYRLHSVLQLAARYEYLSDEKQLRFVDAGAGVRLHTTTLTVDVTPWPDVPGLSVRWDNRVEWSNVQLFANTIEEPAKRWFGSTLAVVYYADVL